MSDLILGLVGAGLTLGSVIYLLKHEWNKSLARDLIGIAAFTVGYLMMNEGFFGPIIYY